MRAGRLVDRWRRVMDRRNRMRAGRLMMDRRMQTRTIEARVFCTTSNVKRELLYEAFEHRSDSKFHTYPVDSRAHSGDRACHSSRRDYSNSNLRIQRSRVPKLHTRHQDQSDSEGAHSGWDHHGMRCGCRSNLKFEKGYVDERVSGV